MIQRRHGKPIDVLRLKRPVLADLQSHIDQVASMAAFLAENEAPVPQRECYVCGECSSQPFSAVHGFTYVQCSNCSHVYTTHRYSEAAILRFYERNQYYSQITYANEETCFYRRDHVAAPKVAFLEEHAGADRGLWVDVGAGAGDLVSVAAEHGWNAVGLEISECSVEFARRTFGVSLVPQTCEAFCNANPDSARKAAVVSLIGVVEHVAHPLDLLSRAAWLLESDGLLLVQVPNARSLSSMIQTVFPEHVFRHMSPVSHIMLFTEASLRLALDETGFDLVAAWFLGLDVYELLTTLTAVNSNVQDSALARTLTEHLNELQAVFDRLELSDGIIAVARKRTDGGARAFAQ